MVAPLRIAPLRLSNRGMHMYRVFLFALALLVLKVFFPELVGAFVDLLLKIIELLSVALEKVPASL